MGSIVMKLNGGSAVVGSESALLDGSIALSLAPAVGITWLSAGMPVTIGKSLYLSQPLL